MSRRARLADLYPQKDWLPPLDVVEDYLEAVDKFLYGFKVCYPPIEKVFTAFDRLENAPDIVLVGQDPYPDSQATGIAFQTRGNVYSLSLKRIADSLGNDSDKYPDWDKWIKEFNVLSMNIALTNTGKGQSVINKNIQAWKPIVKRILTCLANLENRPAVILFGGKASAYRSFLPMAIQSRHPAARGKKLETSIWRQIKTKLGNRYNQFQTCTVNKRKDGSRR